MQFPLDIKAWHFEGSSSWCRNPELKSPMWDLDISLLGNILSNGDYLCFWVTYPEVSSWLHYISIPFTHFTLPTKPNQTTCKQTHRCREQNRGSLTFQRRSQPPFWLWSASGWDVTECAIVFLTNDCILDLSPILVCNMQKNNKL